jgi:Right handed beta helix region/Secretion system C-terminal sorting domain
MSPKFLIHLTGLLWLLVPSICLSQPELSGEQDGTLDAGTYLVVGDLSVPNGNTWILSPGVELLFHEGVMVDVEGSFRGYGNEESGVLLTALDTTAIWDGIHVWSPSDSALVLDHTEVSHCTGIDIFTSEVNIRNSSIHSISGCGINGSATSFPFNISNSAIVNCSECGISIASSEAISMENCIISGCQLGFAGEGSVSITGTSFINNNRAIYIHFSEDLLIDRCSFINNSDNTRSCIFIEFGDVNNTISNSLFYNNTYSGYNHLVDSYAPTYISQCTIANTSLDQNVPMFNQEFNLIDINSCIFYGNSGTFSSDTEFDYLAYSCFYSNALSFAGSIVGAGDIIGENDNGDPIDIFSNIFLDPQFVSVDEGDFQLLETSPCINAGDPLLPLNPDDTRADIGAFPFDFNSSVIEIQETELPQQHFTIYPNPSNSSVTIRMDPGVGVGTFQLFDLLGRQIRYGELSSSASLVLDGVASGQYLLQVTSPEYVSSRKLTVLK